MLNSLWKRYQKSQLLRFRDNPKMELTNNRAERALRPGVKSRKVSQRSKNQSRAAITSVTATSRLKKELVLETLAAALYFSV